ncbi:MAG: methyltransferase domain-containing protein [Planctomycetota bacterium]
MTNGTAGQKLAFEVEPAARLFRLRLARYRYHAEVLAERLPDGPSIVVDAGCGKGRLPRYWNRWGVPTKTPRMIGMDIDRKRIGKSKEVGYPNLIAADLTRPWPFRDGTVDAVLCEQVLEHLNDSQFEFALSEIRRVLKPGGTALVGTPVFMPVELLFSPIWTRINALLRRLQGMSVAPHLQHMSATRLRRRVEKSGLQPQCVRGHRVFSLWYAWLEDYEWYYRLHSWFGRHTPSLCGEVTITAMKPRA